MCWPAQSAEMRIALGRMRDSESRYRNFVELSSEAVWRVELAQPMPVSLDTPAQIAWLQTHARVAECNLSYRQLDAVDPARMTSAWQPRGSVERHLRGTHRRGGEAGFLDRWPEVHRQRPGQGAYLPDFLQRCGARRTTAAHLGRGAQHHRHCRDVARASCATRTG